MSCAHYRNLLTGLDYCGGDSKLVFLLMHFRNLIVPYNSESNHWITMAVAMSYYWLLFDFVWCGMPLFPHRIKNRLPHPLFGWGLLKEPRHFCCQVSRDHGECLKTCRLL